MTEHDDGHVVRCRGGDRHRRLSDVAGKLLAMNSELAEHISLMAASILAPMLASYMVSGRGITEDGLAQLRSTAITQAQALWLETLSADLTKAPSIPTSAS